MTQLLEKALTEVYKLSPEKQDAIAAVILEELEDEQRWDKAFAESQDQLAQLAQKVRADIKAGCVKKIEKDENNDLKLDHGDLNYEERTDCFTQSKSDERCFSFRWHSCTS